MRIKKNQARFSTGKTHVQGPSNIVLINLAFLQAIRMAGNGRVLMEMNGLIPRMIDKMKTFESLLICRALQNMV